MVIVSVYTQAHDTYINGIVEEKRDKKIITIMDDFILVHG
jgi:hypothetical protein